MNKTSYCYEANNTGSYNELATYMVLTSANVALFPERLTIVVTPNDDKILTQIAKFIDSKALDFHNIAPVYEDGDSFQDIIKNPVADTDSLRIAIKMMLDERVKVAEDNNTIINQITSQYEATKKSCENYSKWWLNAVNEMDRVKMQVKAIGVLLDGIFPERSKAKSEKDTK